MTGNTPIPGVQPRIVAGRRQDANYESEVSKSDFFQADGKYHVVDALQSIKKLGLAAGVIPPGRQKVIEDQGIGKIYYARMRTSGVNGQQLGLEIEIDTGKSNSWLFNFGTMAELNTRGAFNFQERLARLDVFDDVANNFAQVWTPSKELTYYSNYALWIRNAAATDATVNDLEVHRIKLKDFNR